MLVSVVHDCLTRIDGLYNSLLLGAVNDTGDLAASAMEFAPGMWLNPPIDSGNSFMEVISKSAFATADFYCIVASFNLLVRYKILQLVLRTSSVRSFRMFGTTMIIPSSAVSGIRMLLDA